MLLADKMADEDVEFKVMSIQAAFDDDTKCAKSKRSFDDLHQDCKVEAFFAIPNCLVLG